MIRKDKLPNPWGDDWHLDTQPTVLDIPQGSHLQIIACTDQWVVDKLNTPQTTENGKLLTPNSELLTQNSNLTLNIGPNAHVELCRLQGIDTPAEHLTQLRADMQQGATLSLATITLGGDAHIPTMAEWQELLSNTTVANETLNGVAGRRFTSKINGNSFFVPFTGYKTGTGTSSAGGNTYFWSSTLSSSTNNNAVDVYITTSSANFYSGSNGESRHYGFPIRAVRSR